MHVTHLSWLAVMLATANARREPLPSYTTILPPKEPTKEYINRPRSATLQRRQDVDTTCEVGAGNAVAQDLGAGPGEYPQAFTQLWDWAEVDGCQATGCTDRKEHCVTASAGQDVCIQIDGAFPHEHRDSFIGAARGAFDRTVRTNELSSGVIETGTNLVRIIGGPGENSGYTVKAEVYNKGSSGGGSGCPQTMKTIAASGAQIPEIGTMFGLVGFLCGGLDSGIQFQGEATG